MSGRRGAVLLLGLLGCGAERAAGPDPEPEGPPVPPLLWVTVAPDGASLAVGDTIRMRVSHNTPQQFGPFTFQWAVSDSAVVEVDAQGLVRGKAPGSAGVRAMVVSSRDRGAGVATIHVR